MDLSLNADAALRAYLPPESWNGEAQHRFVFRTEEGDEETLLARLVVVRPDINNKRFEHCVLLRPAGAETARIFVFHGYWGQGESWMTLRAASRFDWSLFEQVFNRSQHGGDLSRFVLRTHQGQNLILRFDADGQGEILESRNEGEGKDFWRQFYRERFDWARHCYTPYDQRDLQFLQQIDADFQNYVQSELNNPTSDIRTTLNWWHLEDEERDALAFHCQNGNWSELRNIAAMALRVRLEGMNSSSNEICEWHFTDIDGTYVRGANLYCDEFLLRWRAALVQVFRPDNINGGGNIIVERPLCIWTHIDESEWRWIRVEPFSQHDLIESHLKLRQWAQEHFPLEEAERLLAL